MNASGVNPKVASERMGHGSTKLTLDVYTHTDASMQADATAKLEAVLFGKS